MSRARCSAKIREDWIGTVGSPTVPVLSIKPQVKDGGGRRPVEPCRVSFRYVCPYRTDQDEKGGERLKRGADEPPGGARTAGTAGVFVVEAVTVGAEQFDAGPANAYFLQHTTTVYRPEWIGGDKFLTSRWHTTTSNVV